MIIAEIGLNHLGDEAYAREYLDSLCAGPVDAITFQIREKTFYRNNPQYAGCVLTDDFYRRAARSARESNKQFGMAICEIDLLKECEEWGTDFYKVLSKDLSRFEFVSALLSTGKLVFVSTGTSGEDDIRRLMDHVGGKQNGLRLVHTQISYDIADVNLRAIHRLRELLGVPVAFGSHCEVPEVLYAAQIFEPSDIFLYVKGRRRDHHPDEKHALHLDEVGSYTGKLKHIALAIGSGRKEKMNMKIKGMA